MHAPASIAEQRHKRWRVDDPWAPSVWDPPDLPELLPPEPWPDDSDSAATAAPSSGSGDVLTHDEAVSMMAAYDARERWLMEQRQVHCGPPGLKNGAWE